MSQFNINDPVEARQSKRALRSVSGMFKRLKCVLVGDQSTEKTKLVIRYTLGEDRTCRTDRGTADAFDNYNANLKIDNILVEIDLWDVADNDNKSVRSLCYPGSEICLVFFNTTDRRSFENARDKWAVELLQSIPTAPWVLVGTHSDKRDEMGSSSRCVQKQEGEELAEEMGAPAYIETTYKTDQERTREVFEQAMRVALHTPYLGMARRAKFVQGIIEGFSGNLESSVDSLNLALWRGLSNDTEKKTQEVTAQREELENWKRAKIQIDQLASQDPEEKQGQDGNCVVQ